MKQILEPHIGWFSGAMIVIGSMIGSGIFVAPSVMANYVPSPGLLIGLWAFAGVFTLLGAICYAELAAMHPHSGGQYVYLREAFGPLCGFLYGWTLFLVIQTGFNAAVSIAFADHLAIFLPIIDKRNVLIHIPLSESLPSFLQSFEINAGQLVACGVIVVLTAINAIGVKQGTLLQNIFTSLKIAGLMALIAAGLSRIGSASEHFVEASPIDVGSMAFLAALAVAMSKALFAYDAWNTATFVAEEVKDPHRNLPRVLLIGTGGVMVIYVLTVVAFIVDMPVPEMAKVPKNLIAQHAADQWFGSIGRDFVIITILVSTFGCVNGLILSGARVIFAMAREGLFFRSCAHLNPTTRTPIAALVYQGAWSCVLTLTGSYNALLTYTTFASVLFGVLTIIGLIRLRATMPDLPRPYRCWGYPLTPALYLIVGIPFLAYVIIGDPISTGIGALLVLSGGPMYLWLRATQLPSGPEEAIFSKEQE